MGREIEKAILSHIILDAKNNDVDKIYANYIPTQKNKPIENFLSNCGFKHENNSWVIIPKGDFKLPECIEFIEE